MNEEFEKWWDEHDKYDWQRDEQYETAKKFFLAGAAAMREKAAEALCANCESEGLNVRCDLCTDIAAIRKIEVE